MCQTATATYALRLIAKSLDQAIANLDEIEAQIPRLSRADTAQLIHDLTAQRDRLDRVYDKFAQLAERLNFDK